jgi:hypothetical protein
LQLSPQERIQAVKPFWEALPQEERIQVLTLSLDNLKSRAKEIVDRQRKQAGTWRTLIDEVLLPVYLF